jgi:hypothetical protein
VAAARAAISKAGHVVVDMADFTADPHPPTQVCKERVRDSDVYVGVIGFRWGSPVVADTDGRSDGAELSYTELEFETAAAAALPRLVFLLGEDTPGTRALLVDPTYGDRQGTFRARLSSSSGLTRATVTTPGELETALLQALHELASRHDVGNAGPKRRSAYLRQVARIAPPELVGREGELAELAAFCLDSRTELGIGQYAWWRAPAWAGKSALMSTFVLYPPEILEGRAHILSFFITARLAVQDTRVAFTTALMQQLVDLTGQDSPPALDEATQEAQLLELLDQAARACQAADQRLVLVVDGLDEDRSVTTGPHPHSIAGLLPAHPPGGMRIIVSGRPNPPIPEDVEPWHPLRDERIIRPLAASDYARGLQQRSEQELRRLLTGTEVEQNLLGLLTAARGGLSSSDLQELTRAPLWEIEDVLHTTSGRTFTPRVGTWQPDAALEVYLLGHEELQAAATRYLGDQRLAGYRDRLHAWADSYRDKGWPPDTPDYLLSDYFRLLVATEDLHRLVACATDSGRHDRMLDLTGGDATALAEMRTALELIAEQHDPDLAAALRLAYQRDRLTDRNANIPTLLPAVWATLGHSTRARALANSITDPDRQSTALVEVVRALTAIGDTELATTVAAEAETAVRSIADPRRQANMLASATQAARAAGRAGKVKSFNAAPPPIRNRRRPDAVRGKVAKLLAAVGEIEQAQTVVGSITDPNQRMNALVAVTRSAAAAGDSEGATRIAIEAAALARTAPDPNRQVNALSRVAEVLADVGHAEHAAAIATEVETAVRSITDREPHRRVRTLLRVAQVRAAAGDIEEAGTAAAEAEAVARSITDPSKRAGALAKAVQLYSAIGDAGRATSVARSITNPHLRTNALVRAIQAAAAASHAETATSIAAEAATAVLSITDPERQESALSRLTQVLAAIGDADKTAATAHLIADPIPQTETMVADSITERHRRATAIAEAARMLAEVGHAELATTVALSIPAPHQQLNALTTVAQTLAGAGDAEQARSAARSITDTDKQDIALAEVVRALAAAGHSEEAEAAARSIGDSDKQANALVEVARVLAVAGSTERAAAIATEAEAVVRSIADADQAALVMVEVAHTLASAGHSGPATSIAARAEAAVRSITNPERQSCALVKLARTLSLVGSTEPASRIAHSITDPEWRSNALVEVARALVTAGHVEQAAQVAIEAETAVRSIVNPHQRTNALSRVAQALAAAGRPDRATTIATEAESAACLITNARRKANTMVEVAHALAAAGDTERAVGLARSITDPYRQTTALVEVARTLATAGHLERATSIAAEAVATARASTSLRRADAVVEAAGGVLAAAGNGERAVGLARSITDPYRQTTALTEVARIVATAGHPERATTISAEAEAVAQTITDPRGRASALAKVARMFAMTGNTGRATTLASTITDPGRRADALIGVAQALADAADTDHASRIAAAACRTATWPTVVGVLLQLDPSVEEVMSEF